MKSKPLLIMIALSFGWAGVLGLGATAEVKVEDEAVAAPQAWDRDTVHLFATLPIQAEGRVKPVDTYASVKLLKLNGRRSCPTPQGTTRTPTEWLLDCLFYPEAAAEYKVFLVDNSDVLVALGLPFENRRARYSYRDLLPAREKLFALARQYAVLPEPHRSLVQSQLLNLANNVDDFEELTHQMDFARLVLSRDELSAFLDYLPDQPEYRLSGLLKALPPAIESAGGAAASGKPDPLARLVHLVHQAASSAGGLALLPPPQDSPSNAWLTPGDVMNQTLAAAPGPGIEGDVELLALLEDMAQSPNDRARFSTALAAFHSRVTGLAEARGEYGKIGLEVLFYRADLFYRSLLLYVLSFVLVALSWLRPRTRLLNRAALATVLLATIPLACGIALRCVIRGRPPVTTLYETILFAAAMAVVVSLVVEFINHKRVGLALAAILGMAGLFLANKYEVSEGVDTMPSLVAVLDTNFWLATHVTTITIGYAASLLAGAIAHLYLLGKPIGLKKRDPRFFRELSGMVYGVFCFGLIFTILGTVLGGIWANESWGRFWGWDPKENGALMIVLWQLAVLHARSGGYIGDFGLNFASIAGGVIVAFSWFGVNLLGVGLHSYGFTSGTFQALLTFYIVEAAVLLIGSAARVWEGGRGKSRGSHRRGAHR